MQTSLQSFKSSRKVNILDETTGEKKSKIKNVGSVTVALQIQRKPLSLSATKRRWDLHLKSSLLTKMKKISSVLLKINIKLAFVTFTYYCYLKITSKAQYQSLNTNNQSSN